ncbi:uncharacterized protein PAC_15637 [Phialocephala subalpina]|uniref:Uncharacterized protein n=1 Tax=Phialocephala subalpina TaxID=576137 RepID=A0A1L7XLC1_9HELO|nr:uncharacterized protein PAC_15637 [Phialocephala subalpina]
MGSEKVRVAGSEASLERRRSHSASGSPDSPEIDDDLRPRKRTPLSFRDLDRMNEHICLKDFEKNLQKAANAIFPDNQTIKYTNVDVLLLSWAAEDPKLPVSLEIQELANTFSNLYGYKVEKWLIPAENSHNCLQGKILQFLGADEVDHLKIVIPSKANTLDRPLTVIAFMTAIKIGARLLDGQAFKAEYAHQMRVTGSRSSLRLAFNVIANGSANTRYLYNAIFSYIQGWRIEDSYFKKPPVHLILTQNPKLPRSICRGKLRKVEAGSIGRHLPPTTSSTDQEPLIAEPLQPVPLSISETLDASSSSAVKSEDPTPGTSLSPQVQLPEWPRLLLSIRFTEDVKAFNLLTELFGEWLRSMPAMASTVKVESKPSYTPEPITKSSPRSKSKPHGTMDSPFDSFHDHEKRVLIAEALKESLAPIDELYGLLVQDGGVPDWDNMSLPPGRTLTQCRRAFESIADKFLISSSLATPPS